jgi:ATP-dependent DNA helicase RecQ
MAMQGLCIVVSPLIALMKDQVEQLQRRQINAKAIYSGMSARETDYTLDNCIYGAHSDYPVKFLYVSPERLKTSLFLERASRMPIALLAIDEAHCISQWGYDFRPPYLDIAAFRELIPQVTCIALTASATPKVQTDIQEKLHFRTGSHLFSKSFVRDNLSYAVLTEENKEGKLLKILNSIEGTSVIYAGSRRRTQEIAHWLSQNGISATYYHAGLEARERAKRQDDWIQDKVRVVVATNAFGMGIDKPDVRTVIHVDVPASLEAYYQEAGRAGRDGEKAYAVLLYQPADLEKLSRKVEESYPSVEILRLVYQRMANYLHIAINTSELESYDFDFEAFVALFKAEDKISPNTVFNALRLLADLGFISLNDVNNQPSQLQIVASRQAIYELQVSNPVVDYLVKTLLRLYGGEIFTVPMPVAEPVIANRMNTSPEEVARLLQMLSKQGMVQYFPRSGKPQLTFLTPRYSAAQLPVDMQAISYRKQRDKEKAEAMQLYVKQQRHCRNQVLVKYFGENYQRECGLCDVCIAKRKTKHLQQSSMAAKILQKLKLAAALTPEELVLSLPEEPEADLLLMIRYMVDSGELRYNRTGSLSLGAKASL